MDLQTMIGKRRGYAGGRSYDFANRKKGQPGSMLQKFFIDQLKDIYWAEQHLIKALTKLAKAATTEEVRMAFETHRQETEEHVERLKRVFEMLGRNAQGKTCEAMEGLLKEGETIMEETEEDSVTRDVALIIAAQKVEHYEIATYGGLVELALTMGLNQVAEVLETTLQEEHEADAKLTAIAESHINWEAEQEAGKN